MIGASGKHLSALIKAETRLSRGDIGERLYYLAFVLYFVAYWLSFTTLELGFAITAVQVFAMVLLLVKMVGQRYRVEHLVILPTLMLISFLSWLSSDDKSMVYLLCLVMAGQNIKVSKLAKMAFISILAVICSVVLLSTIDLIPVVLDVRQDGFVRTSMGFTHPNRLAAAFLTLSVSYYGFRYPKFGNELYFIIIGSLVFTSAYCDSRGVQIALVSLAAVSVFMRGARSGRVREQTVLRCMLITFIFIFASTFLFVFFYDKSNPIMLGLNNLLSGRLELASFYWKQYPPRFFGQSFEHATIFLDSFQEVLLDNAYARAILVFGWIPGGIFLLSCGALFVSCCVKKDLPPFLQIAFVYIVFGFVESQMLHFAVNYGLIGLSGLLYPQVNSSKDYLAPSGLIETIIRQTKDKDDLRSDCE